MTLPANAPDAAAAGGVAGLLARLAALHPREIDLSLDRMVRVLAALGEPHRRLPPTVHVAGTNGKGSTVAVMRAALAAAGRTVHVYTSPHLVRFNERIVLAGRTIDDDRLAAALRAVAEANGDAPLTQFEAQTAAAFVAFAAESADVLLLETGLGGRLDATNVVDPVLSVISRVGHDHQESLAPDLAGTPAEKAGILKPHRPAVVAAQEPAAAAAILAAAAAVAAPVALGGRDWHWRRDGDAVVLEDGDEAIELGRPGLAGRHQYANAALAAVALRRLGDLAPPTGAIRRGVAEARWPGRLQQLADGPLVRRRPDLEIWIDGGHNPAAAAALADWAAGRTDRPLHLVAGMMARKDADGFLAPLAPHVAMLHAVPVRRPGGSVRPGSHPPEALLAAAARLGIAAAPHETVAAAIDAMPAAARVLATGSLYLVGAILAAAPAAAGRAA